MCFQKGDFLAVRLVLRAGAAAAFNDNDAVLLSKGDPNVSCSLP